MVSKAYAVLCSLFALTASVLFVTGNFPAITAIVFGFIAFGLVFMGMMFVLPYTMSHDVPISPSAINEAERSPSSTVQGRTFTGPGSSATASSPLGSKQPA
jgi:hypothetical protein